MSDSFTKWLQSRLTAHNFPVGPIDGFSGPLTKASLKAFQSSRGLSSNGIVGAATEAALRASASVISPVEAAAITAEPVLTAAAPSSVVWPKQSSVPAFFGAVGQHQKTIDLPYEMTLSWAPGTRVRRMTVHEKVADAVQEALHEVASIYTLAEREALGLNVFGGSLNVRRMRGGTSYSMHSWGIAIDFDPVRNGLTTRAPLARLSHEDAKPFRDAFRKQGATSLGEAIGRDWMHFQFARL